MKKIYSLVIIAIISVIFLFSCTSNKDISRELTIDEKIEEFEYLYDVIKTSYPYLEVNKRMNNVDWLSKKDIYLNRIKDTENDEEYIRVLDSIIKQLNNKHTHLLADEDTFNWLYGVYKDIGWYSFFENKKVINRYNVDDTLESTQDEEDEEEIERIVSQELILEDVVEDEIGYIYLPQMYGPEQVETDMIEIKKYLSTIKDYEALIIDIRENSGGSDIYWMSLMENILPREYSLGGYILFRDSEIISNYLKNRRSNTENITKLPEEVLENAPKEVKEDFKSFIENSSKITPSEDSIRFEGNIYLLVNNRVYSSAESFAIFCKEEKVATLIGEKTAGDGGGIDPILFDLPNSGLIVRMASDMYITKSGVCNEEFKTIPDYEIKGAGKASDFKYDACIKKVLYLENIN